MHVESKPRARERVREQETGAMCSGATSSVRSRRRSTRRRARPSLVKPAALTSPGLDPSVAAPRSLSSRPRLFLLTPRGPPDSRASCTAGRLSRLRATRPDLDWLVARRPRPLAAREAVDMARNGLDNALLDISSILGNALGAGLALQCTYTQTALANQNVSSAQVIHVGSNQQAIGAWFRA